VQTTATQRTLPSEEEDEDEEDAGGGDDEEEEDDIVGGGRGPRRSSGEGYAHESEPPSRSPQAAGREFNKQFLRSLESSVSLCKTLADEESRVLCRIY
jgi:hypothetical protein